MAIDITAAARALIATLNQGGSWDSQNQRSGGTWPGGIAAGNCYAPAPPYDGATPALFVSSVPLISQVTWEGAGSDRADGTLELYYLDRTAEEQGRSLALIDAAMGTNINAIIAALRADPHLGGAVGAITRPIETIRDPQGLFSEWLGAEWVFAAIRVPFIGLPT